MTKLYPKIAAQATQEGRGIQRGDETGLGSELSVISTMTDEGQMQWKVLRGALNVKWLVRRREKRIFLSWTTCGSITRASKSKALSYQHVCSTTGFSASCVCEYARGWFPAHDSGSKR
jgi:predicted RNA-binding Zn-ribbon protein involved in translation (DUF1610 family)